MQPQAHKKQLYFYELAMYYWKLKLKKKKFTSELQEKSLQIVLGFV